MFSHEPRCVYRHNQLAEVICQLRFPEILSIGTTVPDKFQEAIRAQFPQYSKRMESAPPRLTGAPGNFSVQKQEPTVNHQFTSADGTWRVNLTSSFISLACSRYTCWEDFAKKLDKPLVSFIKIYKPAYFERIGLRYVNFFSRKDLSIEQIPYRELIADTNEACTECDEVYRTQEHYQRVISEALEILDDVEVKKASEIKFKEAYDKLYSEAG